MELKGKIEEINKEKNEITSKLLTSSEKLTRTEKNYSDKENELAKMRFVNIYSWRKRLMLNFSS